MTEPRSPKVLCVPVNSKRSRKSARTALTGARNAAQGYRRMKRRQLTKARGQLVSQGGLSVQAQQSIKFRQDNTLNSRGLTLPFALVRSDVIGAGFLSALGGDALNETFISELFGSTVKADAAVFVDSDGAQHVTNSGSTKITPAYTYALSSALVEPQDGSWLVYFNLNSPYVSSYLDVLCVRFGNSASDIRRSVSEGFSLKALVGSEPIRVVFTSSSRIQLGSNNDWRYFNIPEGLGNVDAARIAEEFEVGPSIVSSSGFTAKPLGERPYGPDFNAIRPPGTPPDFPYAVVGDAVSSIDVLNFYNRLLRECWSSIRDGLNGQDRDKFLAHYPRSNSLSLPRGAFNMSSTRLWLRTTALANSVYEVSPLSFDMRPNSDGAPATSTRDPGPYDQERGLLTDGTPLVRGALRPDNVKFDNREGSLVVRHADEVHPLENVDVAPLRGRSNDKDVYPGELDKLEYVVRMRAKHAKLLMYGPYNDFATIASLFRAELGDFLYLNYNEDPQQMLNTLTSAQVNANIPNTQFKETWGTLAIRVVMGSRYSDVSDLPNVFGTDSPPSNATRLLPFKTPSRSDVITVYGDFYDPNLNGAEIRNYARQDVHGFDFGARALFRSVPAKRIVIHWGGTRNGWRVDDGGAIGAMLSTTRHSPSTHFTIDHRGEVVNQHAELAATTGHAYGFNFDSIGIDIPNIGAILNSYKSSVTTGYTSIGYTVIQTPFYSYALGRMLISPIKQYETMYALIEAMCALRGQVQGIHTDQLRFDPEPIGILNIEGKTAVAVSSLVGGKNSEKFKSFRDVGGVCCHLHVATTGKTDGIDGYIYYTLRYKMNDNREDAYRRMKLTLQGNVKQTPQGVKYLTLDRS